jgi:hypothetical protein
MREERHTGATLPDTKLHAEIALAIKAAKKKLFKRHREGMPLSRAGQMFLADMAAVLYGDMAPDKTEIPDHVAWDQKDADAVWDALERNDDDKLCDLVFPETKAQHVIATLPDGQEVELYGDAVDLKPEADADDDRKVMRAMYELLHNPQTPESLYQEISEFVTDQSNECGENLYHSTSYLTEVLKSVKPEERIGVVLAREAGGAQ